MGRCVSCGEHANDQFSFVTKKLIAHKEVELKTKHYYKYNSGEYRYYVCDDCYKAEKGKQVTKALGKTIILGFISLCIYILMYIIKIEFNSFPLVLPLTGFILSVVIMGLIILIIAGYKKDQFALMILKKSDTGFKLLQMGYNIETTKEYDEFLLRNEITGKI